MRENDSRFSKSRKGCSSHWCADLWGLRAVSKVSEFRWVLQPSHWWLFQRHLLLYCKKCRCHCWHSASAAGRNFQDDLCTSLTDRLCPHLCVSHKTWALRPRGRSFLEKAAAHFGLWNAKGRGEGIFVAMLKAINVSSCILNMLLSPFQPFSWWQLSLWKLG